MKTLKNKWNQIKNMATSALMVSALVFGITAAPANAAAKIKEAEYEGKGKVEIDFFSKVEYKNLKVTAKDQSGKNVKVKIEDADDDDLTFKLKSFKSGSTYTYKISGIRKKGESKYGTIKGSIKIPKSGGSVPVEKVEYDAKDREVSFEFETKIEYKNLKVTISDGKKNYVTSIDDDDDEDFLKDEVEVKVKKLKKGVMYHYTISGIKKAGDKKFTSISGNFQI